MRILKILFLSSFWLAMIDWLLWGLFKKFDAALLGLSIYTTRRRAVYPKFDWCLKFIVPYFGLWLRDELCKLCLLQAREYLEPDVLGLLSQSFYR